MKKIIFLLLLIFGTGTFAQTNNAIIINQGTAVEKTTLSNGEIFINGISSKEDVGGVEVSKGKYRGNGRTDLLFKNYNKFPVSVVFIVHSDNNGNISESTGSIVLSPGQSKFSRDTYVGAHDFRIIARKLIEDSGSHQRINETSLPVLETELEPLDGILIKYGGYFFLYPDFVRCSTRDIASFVNNLNEKKVYGRSNWRVATPIEAGFIYKDGNLPPELGTTENLVNKSYMLEYYNYMIVCE